VEGQSFSQGVKDELARDLPERHCCQRSLFASILLAASELIVPVPGVAAQCVLELSSASAVRLVLRLTRRFEGPPTTWEAVRTRRLGVGTRYRVRLGAPLTPLGRRFLNRIGLQPGEGARFDASEYSPARRRCCRRAFAQGAFLVGGSVEDPHRAYHLEWTLRDEALATLLAGTLQEMELPVRRISRRYHAALYLKAANDVGRALTLMGATRGLLVLEEIRAVKETKNLIHRRVNCETANLARLSEAAGEQVALLRRLELESGFRRLPAELRPLARARLRLPEASYQELGRALDPPLTKASIGRRLQRLLDATRRILEDAGGRAGSASAPGPMASVPEGG
jgi:DNA-binding protein WhiA